MRTDAFLPDTSSRKKLQAAGDRLRKEAKLDILLITFKSFN
jgi:hypothetical protein